MAVSSCLFTTPSCLVLFSHKTSSSRSSLVAATTSSIPVSSTTAFPALAYSTILHFKSTYNVHVTVGDDEPEDKLINRFRKEVLKAGVLQECRRRRFFENKHDKIKRKAREASRRNRKRKPPQLKTPAQNKYESSNKEKDNEDDDNWEFPDVDIPYC